MPQSVALMGLLYSPSAIASVLRISCKPFKYPFNCHALTRVAVPSIAFKFSRASGIRGSSCT